MKVMLNGKEFDIGRLVQAAEDWADAHEGEGPLYEGGPNPAEVAALVQQLREHGDELRVTGRGGLGQSDREYVVEGVTPTQIRMRCGARFSRTSGRQIGENLPTKYGTARRWLDDADRARIERRFGG